MNFLSLLSGVCSAVWQWAWRLWTALQTARKWWKWRMSHLSSLLRNTLGRASVTSSTVAGKTRAWSRTRLRTTSSLYRRRMKMGPTLTACITLVSCLDLNICVPSNGTMSHVSLPRGAEWSAYQTTRVQKFFHWAEFCLSVQECHTVAEKTHCSTQKSPRKSARRPSWCCRGNRC